MILSDLLGIHRHMKEPLCSIIYNFCFKQSRYRILGRFEWLIILEFYELRLNDGFNLFIGHWQPDGMLNLSVFRSTCKSGAVRILQSLDV